MKPVNFGGHSAYQNRVLTQLRKYYPDAVNSLSSSAWQILDKFWNLDLSAVDTLMQDQYSAFGPEPRLPSDMAPCARLWEIFNTFFLKTSVANNLISLKELVLAGDGTPLYTAAQERKTRTCKCLEKGIRDCRCDRIYHQPDCDIGWDSHRSCYYFGYGLYMLTASDSENDLPVFPFLSPASRHDSHGFLYNWFSMKQMLPDAVVRKLILDSAHDAMPYYDYCKANGIAPFIDLN